MADLWKSTVHDNSALDLPDAQQKAVAMRNVNQCQAPQIISLPTSR